MMENRQQLSTTDGNMSHHVSSRNMVCGWLAGVAVGGILLGMMGFSFFATLALVLISSPVLLLFSPLLLFAGSVLVGGLTGFFAAMAMAVAGLSAVSWICKEVRGYIGFRGEGGDVVESATESYERMDLQPRVHGKPSQEDRLIRIE